MEWFEVKDAHDQVYLINASYIMNVSYHADTDLTVIEWSRAAYGALYVRGNITMDIKRLLNSHDNYVSRIGAT